MQRLGKRRHRVKENFSKVDDEVHEIKEKSLKVEDKVNNIEKKARTKLKKKFEMKIGDNFDKKIEFNIQQKIENNLDKIIEKTTGRLEKKIENVHCIDEYKCGNTSARALIKEQGYNGKTSQHVYKTQLAIVAKANG